MIKTKIGDIFIKDKNFYDENFIDLKTTEQYFEPSEYPDLLNKDSYISKSYIVEELSFNSNDLLYNNFKNAKVIDINNDFDNFLIVENENSRGNLYRQDVNYNYNLIFENISNSATFKSYLAIYLKDSLIIVHSDNNSIVKFTKITQNDFGQYEKINFSEILGNYKLISINKHDNIIFLSLCDNITTYIYKIENYVVSLNKTITENIVFEEQKVTCLNQNGLKNIYNNYYYYYNSFHLTNDLKKIKYNMNDNTYSIYNNEIEQGIKYKNFEILNYNGNVSENGNFTEEDFFNFQVPDYFISNLLNVDDKTFSIYLSLSENYDLFIELETTEFFTFNDYVSDAFLLNISYNYLMFIYKADDNKTKFYINNNLVYDITNQFSFLYETTIDIKNISYCRQLDKIYIYITDKTDNIHKIIFDIVTNEFTETKIIIKALFKNLKSTNHKYFLKAK